MSEFIPLWLVPPGVNDQRSRDFASTLSAFLGRFETRALMIQDPLTVDARLLPAMTVELGMTDFMTPGLKEEHVRELLARAPEIHAWTGTVYGTRRALGAIGVTVDWQQWWQQQPPGYHDTHVVVAYVNEHLFAGQPALLTEATQRAVLRIIEATKRWSQDILFKLGACFRDTLGAANAASGMAVAHDDIQAGPDTTRRSTLGMASAASGLMSINVLAVMGA